MCTPLNLNNIDKLLATCNTPKDRLLVLLFSQAGLRVAELIKQKIQDIDLEKGVLTVTPTTWGQGRQVDLTQATVQVIREYLPLREYVVSPYLMTRPNGELLDPENIRYRIRYVLGRKAGIDVSVQSLRKLSPNTPKYSSPSLRTPCAHDSNRKRIFTRCKQCGEKLMATFYISRKKQFLLILEGCGGQDTESRERRLKVAKFIQNLLPNEQFEPSDLYSYDLSLLLEKLNEDAQADVFEAYLNTF